MNIFPEIQGEIESWDALVLGHLMWNRYFGESKEDPPRGKPSTCSSVLVCGQKEDGAPYRLIVDPTIRHSPEEYYFDLNRRTGLSPESITHCFCTHHHFDHWNGLKYFPQARWLTGRGNLAPLREAVWEAVVAKAEPGDGGPPGITVNRVEEVEGEFLPGVWAIPLPGHTAALHGVAFSHRGKRVLAAADAVMTGRHLEEGRTEFQPDPAMQTIASEIIGNIAESFDIVVPGHDNIIVL